MRLRLKAAAVAAASLAAMAATPGAAHAAAVRPAFTACGENLAIFPGSQGGQNTMNVSGEILFCGTNTWIEPYLVLYKVGPGGSLIYAASGVGDATYVCQGTTENLFEMGGEIPDGLSYEMYDDCG